ALPTINSSIVLEGNGFTIDGNNSFQVLHVSGTNGLTLNNATITGGSGDVSGAGIGCTYCIMTVNNSTITGNSSNINGGGIYMNDGSRVVINNSTISGNTAYMGGGGIDVFTAYVGGELTINNSTITGNSTSDGSSGGGISATYVYNPLSVQLNRTIVSGNTSLAAIRAEIECWSDCYGNNYNIIGYGGSARSEGFTPSGTDVVPAGALSTVLDTNLADHGGPTFIHALVLGSPAIDIAPSAACSAAPVNGVDQRGMARNIDGLGDGDAGPGLECDAGAHELQSPTAVTFAGLTSSGAGKAAPAALGATGVLALLTGGWLARSRRRKV
ncbi:MAG: hypothetical protein KC413_24850, partial [Anaerolineales bacterium]|nr:hypothetical protein [Anaerolineales bacterium]